MWGNSQTVFAKKKNIHLSLKVVMNTFWKKDKKKNDKWSIESKKKKKKVMRQRLVTEEIFEMSHYTFWNDKNSILERTLLDCRYDQ